MADNFILVDLQGSPNVIGYYGDDVSIEKGRQFYNLFIEYASLGDRVRRCSRVGLPEVEVKGFTKGILKGLKHVHESNYVHCDLKLDNVLLVQTYDGVVPKLEDFGLAKGVGKKKQQGSLRGTPLYMAPESIHYAEYEPKSDIWAFGLVVLKMLTGREAWDFDFGDSKNEILYRIGYTDELPYIPSNLSVDAQDFLKKCLVKNVASRWSIDMLLSYPFIAGDYNKEVVKGKRTREAAAEIVLPPRTPSASYLPWPKCHSYISIHSSGSIVASPGIQLQAAKRRKITDEVEEEVLVSSHPTV